jgi:hypothetical protein
VSLAPENNKESETDFGPVPTTAEMFVATNFYL